MQHQQKGSPLKYNHIITNQISTGNSNGTTVPKTMARVLLSVYVISTWPAAYAGPASVQHALCIRWMQDIVGQEWASCTCNLCLFGLELTTILPALEGLEIVVSLATFSLGNLWSFSWLPYSLLVLLTTSSTLNLVFHMTIYSTWLLCLLPLVMFH